MVKLKHARGYRPACLFVVSHPEVTVGQADRADAETSQQSVASVCFKFSHQYPITPGAIYWISSSESPELVNMFRLKPLSIQP